MKVRKSLTLNEVLQKHNLNRDELSILMRKAMIPHITDYESLQLMKLVDDVIKYGASEEYEKFHRMVKEDFRNFPISYL